MLLGNPHCVSLAILSKVGLAWPGRARGWRGPRWGGYLDASVKQRTMFSRNHVSQDTWHEVTRPSKEIGLCSTEASITRYQTLESAAPRPDGATAPARRGTRAGSILHVSEWSNITVRPSRGRACYLLCCHIAVSRLSLGRVEQCPSSSSFEPPAAPFPAVAGGLTRQGQHLQALIRVRINITETRVAVTWFCRNPGGLSWRCTRGPE